MFPASLMQIYSIFIPISTLDVVPEEITLILFMFSEMKQRTFSERLEILGHETMNTVNNLGSIFYFVIIYIVLTYFSFFRSSSDDSNHLVHF